MKNYSVEQIKAMGKNKTNFNELVRLFYVPDLPLDVKREVVSSIGRCGCKDEIYAFISVEAFNGKYPMELVYQMFRTCLYKSRTDKRFDDLRRKMR